MFKRLALQLLRVPGAEMLFAPFARGRGVVFMLHRFRSPEHGIEGCDSAMLRRALAHLRRERYRLLSIEELLRYAIGGHVPDRAVSFTIDDGYFDHATIAAPVFAEFDCPVTTFVTTGVLDRQLWFWWDRIEYVFTHTRRRTLRISLGARVFDYDCTSPEKREAARADFAERCKEVRDEEKGEGIARLAAAGEVDLPTQAPAAYAPMTWDQLRTCERHGMTFGPHTVTHPVLSRVSDERSRWELSESWRRLRDEASAPVRIFCYPNGRQGDFSDREIATLEQLGFAGAVVGAEGFVSARSARRESRGAFAVRRYPFPADLPHVVQYVSGVECAKALLRGQPA